MATFDSSCSTCTVNTILSEDCVYTFDPSIDAETIEPSSNPSVSEAKSVGLLLFSLLLLVCYYLACQRRQLNIKMKCKQSNVLTVTQVKKILRKDLTVQTILLKNNSSTQSLTDEEKNSLLTHHFKPGGRYVLPKTKLHNKMRSFQRSWQTAYPWLVYSESENGGFCKYCMLFATYNATGVLVSSALKNFNKATDVLKEHHTKEYHIAASVKAEIFIKIMQKPQKAISSIIDLKDQP